MNDPDEKASPYRDRLIEWQREYMRNAFEQANHSVQRVVEITGISRQHIYKFCDKLGIELRKSRVGRRPRREGNEAWRALS